MSRPPLTPLDTVLVANRGEIACRIARSARARGHRVAMVFTDADRDAPHADAGDLALWVPDYLDGDAIIAAAARLDGTVGVHPGYGFLAENAAFARAVAAADLVWIGPSADAIAAMGDKAAARKRVADHGVPVAPGYDGQAQDLAHLAERAREIGTPLLVKAAAGGGGKGMRVVRDLAELGDAVAEAKRLAASAFGDDRIILERFLAPARHVEVQILADAHGTTLHLLERECSVQRRHQKVVEEAPSPALSPDMRQRLCADAVRAARAVGYVSAGTVEFILGPDGQHYFLEMNTRLQVEHPVTECITGLDLVDLQLHVAEGRPLPLSQEDVRADGWAIEARLYAEDAAAGWLPSPGVLHAWSPPPGVRVDAGVQAGSEIGTAYDPMLAKVVAHGADREQARRRLVRALERLVALGPTTGRGAVRAILTDPRFVAGDLSTAFLDGWTPPAPRADWRALCAVVAWELQQARAARVLPEVPLGWRNNRWRDAELTLEHGEDAHRLRWRERAPGVLEIHRAPAQEAVPTPDGGERSVVRYTPVDGGVRVEVDGVRETIPLVADGERHRVHRPAGDLVLRRVPDFLPPGSEAPPGSLAAPMTGTVVRVDVAVGDVVEEGQVLVVLEAMKMEQTVRAPHGGTVTEVRVTVGSGVDAGAPVVVMQGGEDGED